MISGERMDTFLASLDAGNTPFLDQIEREALETNVPIIRTQTQGLLRFLLAVRKPMSILEVGCAIGFSALLMSEYAPGGCRITTIEKYEKRIPVAKENFARAGKQEAITLLEGPAGLCRAFPSPRPSPPKSRRTSPHSSSCTHPPPRRPD